MKLKACATLILLALLTSGCSTISTKLMKPDVAKLAEEYVTLTGTLAAPPVLMNGNHRLVLFFAEQPKPDEPSAVVKDGNGDVATDMDGFVVKAPQIEKGIAKEVLTCVAENEQNKEVLINLKTYLTDPKAQGKLVYIYGRRIEGPWNEYTSGMNFYVEAVGFYIPESGQYMVVTTGFGDGMFDQVSWTSFLKQIAATAIKGAL